MISRVACRCLSSLILASSCRAARLSTGARLDCGVSSQG
jgi:hypothetical protein